MYKRSKGLYYWNLTQTVGEETELTDGIDEIKIVRTDTEQIVIIGGSSSDWREWFNNLLAHITVNGVHRGFSKSANRIYELIKDQIDISQPLTIIGHSRGGAIAQAMAYLFYKKATVFSFGAPKVFLRKITPKFLHYCYRSKGDGVTRLPWGWKAYGIIIELGSIKGMDHTQYGKLIKRDLFD